VSISTFGAVVDQDDSRRLGHGWIVDVLDDGSKEPPGIPRVRAAVGLTAERPDRR
jgi:hypothetical protein